MWQIGEELRLKASAMGHAGDSPRELAGQNILHHKPPEFLMGKQIKHLVSG
jgi:hypothetical protein